MSLSLQSVRVATGFDEEGVLVFDEEQRLVAVLVRLLDDNEVAPGQWYVEAGFGRLNGINRPAFAALDAALGWIGQRAANWTALRPVG